MPKLLRKKIIYGCDSRGDGNSPYLTRFTILETKLGAAYIHVFHRSDADEHHDHPWHFLSVILWRGYVEETACSDCGGKGWNREDDLSGQPWQIMCDTCIGEGKFYQRVWPGMILFRKATHRHRVELVEGRRAMTFVVRGPYIRQWGFFTSQGWQNFKDYFKERGC